ncbi:plasmid mobilization relaxosome protein MobC [Actimicrobium sp. CCI2.3]|uniref:plasmid mobilization relaxosome protein MobC n=1 Tax=Actimicrobium sp. CCI2.3 TaxID=3048616 RepID=UPI002B24F8A5|nr:plasmid mobilization relaxosome protein MobC [Actimicrobium sp. CCI2.3]MEB0023790.1 plasmid mobilization relaxosome protein MobC [Actimicrobium sp. CCI2.3]
MARPLKSSEGALGHMLGFRLNNAEFDVWDKKVKSSGLNKAEYFRQAVIDNRSVIQQKVHVVQGHFIPTKIFSAASNNLNQLARALNTANKAGTVSNHFLEEILSTLQSIESTLRFK